MGIPLLETIGKAADRLFGVIDSIIPDKDLAARLKHETEMAFVELNMAQMAVNAEEAKHASLFVAGWRPFIGWVCGSALAWEYIGAPLAQWALTMAGLELAYSVPTVPTDSLFELVLAMLGMAGLRTYEKHKGVARG